MCVLFGLVLFGFHLVCMTIISIVLTLLDLSGLFNADRDGLANESHDDGIQSSSFSDMLLSLSASSTESGSENGRISITHSFECMQIKFNKFTVV